MNMWLWILTASFVASIGWSLGTFLFGMLIDTLFPEDEQHGG